MPPQPNIIVVLSDQLRRDALRCYGDANIATPHTDALAARGTRFDNACSTYPICVPFRFTLMTGEYAHSRMVPGIEWRMSPAERTLADEFNDASYETIYVGKWHLDGGHGRQGFETAKSVNRHPVPRSHQGRWQHWRGFELRNGPFDTVYFIDDDPTPHMIEGYQTDGLFDLAMERIEQRDTSKPFACVLSVEPPHPPYEAPPELEDAWRDREISLPPNFLTAAHHLPPEDYVDWNFAKPKARDRHLRDRRNYYAMVENLDQNVGRLDAFLTQHELKDNTIILYVSDHGDHGGSHQLAGKQTPYQESVGIPLIVAGPNVPAGQVIADPTCTEDLMPTILGLCGLSPRNELPGADLAPLIQQNTSSLDREGVMLQFVSELRAGVIYHDQVWRAFRSERSIYVVQGSGTGLKPWAFFDLQADPYELTNLIDDPASQPVIAHHHALLYERMQETNDPAPLAAAYEKPTLNERTLT